jgi:hypothetical protein
MSTIKTTNISNLTGTSTVPTETVVKGTAKAWVNFSGVTEAISGAFNVSSITDAGNAQYVVNYITAAPDLLYCPLVSGSSAANSGNSYLISPYELSRTTTSFTIHYGTLSLTEPTVVSFAMFY